MFNVLRDLPQVSKARAGRRAGLLRCRGRKGRFGRADRYVRFALARSRRIRGNDLGRKPAAASWTSLPEVVYISFDIDGLTIEHCPHTGTPVPGGITFEQVVYLMECVADSGRRIAGFDLVEVVPCPEDKIDAVVGARVLYKLCGLALRTSSAGRG